LIVLVFAVGGYFTYNHFGTKAKEKAKKERIKSEKEGLRESTRAAINKMVSKFDAIDNWDEKLREIVGDKEVREIFTMELQNLWLIDRPILFMGQIEDVANNDDDLDTYSISIFYSLYNKFDFGSRLLVSLKCPKTLLNSFFREHPKVLSDTNDVAVIAKIKKVSTHFERVMKIYKKGPEEQDREEYKEREFVGIGLCLDIIELPVDVFP
jgi:hypothetical protein